MNYRKLQRSSQNYKIFKKRDNNFINKFKIAQTVRVGKAFLSMNETHHDFDIRR